MIIPARELLYLFLPVWVSLCHKEPRKRFLLVIGTSADGKITCCVSLTGFLDTLRFINGIEGKGLTVRHGLYFLGIKDLGRNGQASIYFSQAPVLHDEFRENLQSICRHSNDTKILVLSTLSKLSEVAADVHLADLSDCFHINWPWLHGGSPPEVKQPDYALKCGGSTWRFIFKGREAAIRDSKGIPYLAKLLANPGKIFSALELAHPEVAKEGSPPLGRRSLREHIR
jgi:hypothetical protein|tara:strand:+ start:2483 stop:3166 length:684 start_codon:yes stop_codon:yes gene_type:complete